MQQPLTARQSDIVRQVIAWRDRDVTCPMLAVQFGMTPKSMAEHLDRIISKGLLARRRTGRHTYRYEVVRQKAREAGIMEPESHSHIAARHWERMNEEERDEFLRLAGLDKLTRPAFDPASPDGVEALLAHADGVRVGAE